MGTDKQNMKLEEYEIHLLNTKGTEEKLDKPKRAAWASQCEYLLSLIGYTVGLGVVYRFPYLCMKNGGGAFLIPFVFFVVVCGLPLYMLELAIGQFSGKSPMVIWSICPLFKGLGYSIVILSLIVTWYQGVIIAWVCYFLVYSVYPDHPWSNCDNSWNTPNCVVSRATDVPGQEWNASVAQNSTLYRILTNTTYSSTSVNNSVVELAKKVTSADEFWRYRILDISKGISDLSSIHWQMVLALLVAFLMSFLPIIKGVRSVGKVAYITAPMPYILLAVILIRSLTLEGSVNGVLYFLVPDFARLKDYHVWHEAALQAFFSLGPGWGGIITMASYNKFSNNCVRDAVVITAVDCFSNIFSGLVVFSIMGYLANVAGLTMKETVISGPGLIFIAYPELLTTLPIPQLWSLLFFIMLLLIGIDSQFGMLETVCSGLVDMFPQYLNKRKKLLLFCIFTFYFFTSLVFATRAGVYVFILVDWYASAFSIFLIATMECIVIGWIYGMERFNNDFKMMLGRPVPLLLRLSICISAPCILTLAFIITIANYSKPVYNDYAFPDYSCVIGIVIGLLSVVPIPLVSLWQLFKSRGSFKSRCNQLLKSNDWFPHDDMARSCYEQYEYSSNILQNIKINLIGHRVDKS